MTTALPQSALASISPPLGSSRPAVPTTATGGGSSGLIGSLHQARSVEEVIAAANANKPSAIFMNEVFRFGSTTRWLAYQSRMCPRCQKHVVFTSTLERDARGNESESPQTCPQGHIRMRGG